MVPGPGEKWYLQNKGGYLLWLAVVRWVVAGWTTGGGDTLGAKGRGLRWFGWGRYFCNGICVFTFAGVDSERGDGKAGLGFSRFASFI